MLELKNMLQLNNMRELYNLHTPFVIAFLAFVLVLGLTHWDKK